MKAIIAALAIMSTVGITTQLTGCVTTERVEKPLAQTTNVDLYFAKSEITRPYLTMGTINTESTELLTFEQLEQELIKKAMAEGADAILIQNMNAVKISTSANSNADDTGNPQYYLDDNMNLQSRGTHKKWTSVSYRMHQRDKVLTGKLIKYK